MDQTQFVIITDSAADLPKDLLEQMQIVSKDLHYTLDGVEREDTDPAITRHEFYERVRAGSMPTTAQMNVETAKELFESYLKQGIDVLYLCFSSALSGTYNSACLAARELEEEYADRKVLVFDTKCASMGQGLFVYLCATQKLKGKTLQEVWDFAEELRPHLCHYFTVEDLHHLHRGGRVSKVSAVVGTALGIKPVLYVDSEGRLIPREKVRGRRNSLNALIKYMKENMKEEAEPIVFISHGDCIDDAQYVADQVLQLYPDARVTINYIGPVIGAHSGPGTVALFFIGKER